RSSTVTSLEDGRSSPSAGDGRKWPTSRGTNGSAMSTRRNPCANHANGITVPWKRSDGWWQPLIGGLGAPPAPRPAPPECALGPRRCVAREELNPAAGGGGPPHFADAPLPAP